MILRNKYRTGNLKPKETEIHLNPDAQPSHKIPFRTITLTKLEDIIATS